MDIIKSYTRSLLLLGLSIFAAIAAWQFYLFATFKGTDGVIDVQGGTIHLWAAIAIGLMTCIGAFFVISGFRRYERRSEMHITSHGSALG